MITASEMAEGRPVRRLNLLGSQSPTHAGLNSARRRFFEYENSPPRENRRRNHRRGDERGDRGDRRRTRRDRDRSRDRSRDQDSSLDDDKRRYRSRSPADRRRRDSSGSPPPRGHSNRRGRGRRSPERQRSRRKLPSFDDSDYSDEDSHRRSRRTRGRSRRDRSARRDRDSSADSKRSRSRSYSPKPGGANRIDLTSRDRTVSMDDAAANRRRHREDEPRNDGYSKHKPRRPSKLRKESFTEHDLGASPRSGRSTQSPRADSPHTSKSSLRSSHTERDSGSHGSRTKPSPKSLRSSGRASPVESHRETTPLHRRRSLKEYSPDQSDSPAPKATAVARRPEPVDTSTPASGGGSSVPLWKQKPSLGTLMGKFTSPPGKLSIPFASPAAESPRSGKVQPAPRRSSGSAAATTPKRPSPLARSSNSSGTAMLRRQSSELMVGASAGGSAPGSPTEARPSDPAPTRSAMRAKFMKAAKLVAAASTPLTRRQRQIESNFREAATSLRKMANNIDSLEQLNRLSCTPNDVATDQLKLCAKQVDTARSMLVDIEQTYVGARCGCRGPLLSRSPHTQPTPQVPRPETSGIESLL